LILTSPSEDIFKIGNLSFYIKNEYILAVSAMPELESPEIEKPCQIIPELWRGWVVAIGPGIRPPEANFTYNPGVRMSDFIYFSPESGKFFSFDDVLFIFVKMSDVVLTTSL